MRLWGYYALHTCVNTVKKLFRSTVAVVILAIVGFGLIFGAAATIIEHVADKSGKESVETQLYEEEELPFDGATLKIYVESGIAAVFLICLLWGMYAGSKKGSDIFLMADVNFLFTAPIRPQSALMFRLTFQMAASVCASVYLLAQIPNFVQLGLDGIAIAAIFVGWLMLLLFQRLMMVLSYTVCSTHERLKSYLLPFLFCIVGAIAAVFATVYVREGRDLTAALSMLCAGGWSRWIPLAGWYKGMIMSAVEGEAAQFLIYLSLLLAGMAAMVWLIWRVKADFYEDALSQASRKEAALAAAKEGRSARVKARPKRIRRTGSFGGWGAGVFFTKAMYDRRRTAWLGFITPTMLLELAVAVLTVLLSDRAAGVRGFFAAGAVLMLVQFFRNFGNPVAQESSKNWLFLVPESAYCKVFYVMLAATASTALDLLPAILAGMLLSGETPYVSALWLAALVAMDFMLSAVGAFLEAVFPTSALNVVKSMLRLLLHFFMLLVVTGLMAAGYLLGGAAGALLLTTAGAALTGGLFFLLYPLLLHGGAA